VDPDNREIRRMTNIISFNDRELATLLAALRFWQRQNSKGEPERDIATDGGTFDPLSQTEIDMFCERIQWPDTSTLGRIGIALDGGILTGVWTDCEQLSKRVNIYVVDYDVRDEPGSVTLPQDDGSTEQAFVSRWVLEHSVLEHEQSCKILDAAAKLADAEV
jgi:hypothetical protein